MVQEFRVLKCFSCSTYQVDMVKKANRWACKMCGEKQTLSKVFYQGSSKDCREHVQKANSNLFSMVNIPFDDLEKYSQKSEPKAVENSSNSRKFDEFFDDGESFEGLMDFPSTSSLEVPKKLGNGSKNTWKSNVTENKFQQFSSSSNFKGKNQFSQNSNFKKFSDQKESSKTAYKKTPETTKPYLKATSTYSRSSGGFNIPLPLVDFHKKDGFKIPPIVRKEAKEKPLNPLPANVEPLLPTPSQKSGSFQFKVSSQVLSQTPKDIDDFEDFEFDENEIKNIELSQM